MGLSERSGARFLEKFQGCYKCVRMTTATSQILVTHLRIEEIVPGIPAFSHIETIPDEASQIPGRGRRVLTHEGVILARGRRATFLSPSGSLRQMTCIISANLTRPAFSGLLMSVDAKHELPFAARVFLTWVPDIEESEVIHHPDYGLFSPDDSHYSAYVPYISNAISPDSVLVPETDV